MLQGFCFSELSFSLNDFSSLVTGKKKKFNNLWSHKEEEGRIQMLTLT